jgi:hypothetical protein
MQGIYQEMLQPSSHISVELMNLTNQLDLDTLSNVMEDFVEIFAPQLSPFAVELCQQLVFCLMPF